MLTGLLGRKVGMTQVFGPGGVAIPVTVIEAGPCMVTQVKTEAHDGYEAVQLGFGAKKLKQATRPELGHLGHTLPLTDRQRRRQQQEGAKARQEARARRESSAASATEADEAEATSDEAAGAKTTAERGSGSRTAPSRRRRGSGKELGPFLVLREVKIVGGETPALGDAITVAMFAAGEEVDVIGTSKGKGFAGVMKRHGFRGGPRTHGQSDRARAPGSIGPGTTPGRVLKGTRMAGRMGNERVTIKALRVVEADPERNLLLVQGSIPGPNGGVVMIRKSAEQQRVAARSARTAAGAAR